MPAPIDSSKNQNLSKNQVQFLRGQAHSLRPVVLIGKEGMSSTVIETVKAELFNHELIKVKINNNSGLDRFSTSQMISSLVGSTLIQLIGKVFVLYKPNFEKPTDKRINLPKS